MFEPIYQIRYRPIPPKVRNLSALAKQQNCHSTFHPFMGAPCWYLRAISTACGRLAKSELIENTCEREIKTHMRK